MPTELAIFFALVAAIGTAAQVTIAVIAVKLSRRGQTISRNAYLQQRLSADLAGVLAVSRDVRRKYRLMFKRFHTIAQKENARSRWLESSEDVSSSLRELMQLCPSAKEAVDAWLTVETADDSYAGSDKLECDAVTREKGLRVYESAFSKFTAAVASVIRSLEDPDILQKK